MNRDQKIVDMMRHWVLPILIGFSIAGILVTNFNLGGWLAAHGDLFNLIMGLCLLLLAIFEWRARAAHGQK